MDRVSDRSGAAPCAGALPFGDEGGAPFTLIEPLRRSTPMIFASPHSGRSYPDDLLRDARVPLISLRRAEDAFVDELFASAAAHGAPVLTATYARAWVDLNRAPNELDPEMFTDAMPIPPGGVSPRVLAGLGAIPRISGDGQDIYQRKLSSAEAHVRLGAVHAPYHAVLRGLMAEARAAFGCAILIDCHSMPSCARGPMAPDIVLGDRFGASCHPAITGFVEAALRRMGYRVARNTPFAGGYTTQAHGRPREQHHALQVEINRGLYMDERSVTRLGRFNRVKADMGRLAAALASAALHRSLR